MRVHFHSRMAALAKKRFRQFLAEPGSAKQAATRINTDNGYLET